MPCPAQTTVTDPMLDAAMDVVLGEGIHDCSTETLRRVLKGALEAALAQLPRPGSAQEPGDG